MTVDRQLTHLESALREAGRTAEYPSMTDLTDGILEAVAQRAGRRAIALPRLPAAPRFALVTATALVAIAVGIGLVVPQLTRVSAAEVIRQAMLDFADVPPFRATIHYELNPDGSDPHVSDGATAEVQLSYGRSGAMRQELVDVTSGVPGLSAGSFLVFDGVGEIGQYLANDNVFHSFEPWEGFESLREFSWNAPYPDWEDICARGGSETLPDTQIAGRAAHHVRCGDWTGDQWELWLDAETGLILKLVGQLGADDFRPGTTEAGGFEVTQIEYGVTFDPETFLVAAPPNAEVPPGIDDGPERRPMRLTFTREFGGTFSGTFSYRDSEAWRLDFTEDTADFIADVDSGFIVWDGSEIVLYDAENNWYSSSPGMWLPPPLVWFDPATDAAFDESSCEEAGTEVVAGREARHLVCGDWQQVPGREAEVWLDAEIGIYLRVVDPGGYRLEVTAMETDPEFAAEEFTFTPPPGAQTAEEYFSNPYLYTSLRAGEFAPAWTAPLLDGGSFDLEAELGRPLLFLLMPDWCPAGDPVCDVLPQLQEVQESAADRATIVWIDLDADEDEAREIVERQEYTFLVVLDPSQSTSPAPDSPEGAWNVTSWPLYVLLDADGRVVEVRLNPQSVDDLNDMFSAAE